ncbi:MAG: hypothetical protein IKS90_00965 [Clostridia bacterium]|nr:hypothetical protein [Clostridia bacterium]
MKKSDNKAPITLKRSEKARLWSRFASSGKVEDYLSFARERERSDVSGPPEE